VQKTAGKLHTNYTLKTKKIITSWNDLFYSVVFKMLRWFQYH